MARYRLINDNGWTCYQKGGEYDTKNDKLLEQYIVTYKEDWQLIEDFVLPEKWCIATENMDEEIKNWFRGQSPTASFLFGLRYYGNFSNIPNSFGVIGGIGVEVRIDDNQIISKEQFKKYVLKQDDMKLIGYKLKDKANEKVLRKAIGFTEDYSPLFFIKGHVSGCLPIKVKELGVFDWLEPVYEPEYTLPKINGYEGRVGKGTSSETLKSNQTVEYGCATINVQWLRNIYEAKEASGCSGVGNRSLESITLDSNVTITVDEIKQIIDYIDNI